MECACVWQRRKVSPASRRYASCSVSPKAPSRLHLSRLPQSGIRRASMPHAQGEWIRYRHCDLASAKLMCHRRSLWVSMNGIAQVIGCLLMYGIGKNSALPLQPWRTLFLVCGGLTCAAGFLFFFLMPSGPKDAWFLTAREKEVLSLRMARDREGGDKTAFSMRQLIESLLDVKVWFVFAFGVLVTMQSPVLTVCCDCPWRR